MVNVNYHNQCKVLELLVAEGAKPTLIGHDWLHDLKLLELQKSMTNKVMHCYNTGGPVSYIAKLSATGGVPEGFDDAIPSFVASITPSY